MKRSVRYNTMVIAAEMKYNDVTVLNYRIKYPEFESEKYGDAVKAINRFYKEQALALESTFRTRLYRLAVDQYLYDVENGYPVRAYEALQTFNITYNSACIISLYFDNYQYTGGAHGTTDRTSQTWNLETRQLIKLNDLFEIPDYEGHIKKTVVEQIRQNPEIYFDNYEELVEQTFNADSFYCTETGVVVYFQQYDIAPYSSGIREFLLPYGQYIMDPAQKCST